MLLYLHFLDLSPTWDCFHVEYFGSETLIEPHKVLTHLLIQDLQQPLLISCGKGFEEAGDSVPEFIADCKQLLFDLAVALFGDIGFELVRH